MSLINSALLFAILSFTTSVFFLLKHKTKVLKPLVYLIVLLICIQVLFEGFYWQFIPAYILLFVSTAFFFGLKSNNYDLRKMLLMRCLLAILMAISIAPWAVFSPIPTLVTPQGEYRVGTRIFRWIDVLRDETATTDSLDKRNVIVQAWYPTNDIANDNHSVYLDGLEQPPNKIAGLPSFLFDHYHQIQTNGILDASASVQKKQWPVVIFLTGNVASRSFYTSLITGIASKGYVVLAVDHPYEAMIATLANGKIATTIEKQLNNDPLHRHFMRVRMDTRIEDVNFLIAQLIDAQKKSDTFFATLDTNRIAIAGHSLGGATAGVALASNPILKAAANIDGTLYGEVPDVKGSDQFLLVESNKSDTQKYSRYEKGNQLFFKKFPKMLRYEIPAADHYSFTDAPFLLASPTRFLASRFLEFGNIPFETQKATIAILDAFFKNALYEKQLNIDSIATSYSGVKKKQTK